MLHNIMLYVLCCHRPEQGDYLRLEPMSLKPPLCLATPVHLDTPLLKCLDHLIRYFGQYSLTSDPMQGVGK